jgi:hypothetical protein
LRSQGRSLVLRQLEHEVGREPVDVPLDLLDQTTCLHPIEFCEVLIDHHVAFANDDDPPLNRRKRDQLQGTLVGPIGHLLRA